MKMQNIRKFVWGVGHSGSWGVGFGEAARWHLTAVAWATTLLHDFTNLTESIFPSKG